MPSARCLGPRSARCSDFRRLLVSPVDDRRADGRPRGHPPGAARGSTTCLKIVAYRVAASPCRKLKVADDPALNAFANRHEREAIRHPRSPPVSSIVSTTLSSRSVLGHELDPQSATATVRMLVIAVIHRGRDLVLCPSSCSECSSRLHRLPTRRRRPQGRRRSGNPHRHRTHRGRLGALAGDPLRAHRASRELLADAGSVELTKNPDAMISALRKIEGRGELAVATSAVIEMCVDNPREEFSDPLRHPSADRAAHRCDHEIRPAVHDPGPLALPDPAVPVPGVGAAGRHRPVERRSLPASVRRRRTVAREPSSAKAVPACSARRRRSGPLTNPAHLGAAQSKLNHPTQILLLAWFPPKVLSVSTWTDSLGVANGKSQPSLSWAPTSGGRRQDHGGPQAAALYYFAAIRVPARAFDTECPKGTLKRFHPDAHGHCRHQSGRRPE